MPIVTPQRGQKQKSSIKGLAGQLDLYAEGHFKNELREQFLRRIKNNITKTLDDYNYALIVKGTTDDLQDLNDAKIPPIVRSTS